MKSDFNQQILGCWPRRQSGHIVGGTVLCLCWLSFCKTLYASISKLYWKEEQHIAYLETSVGVVVGAVKKRHSHQKCCGGTGCAVVQQACS